MSKLFNTKDNTKEKKKIKERQKKKKLKKERQNRIKEKIKNGPVLDEDTIIMRKSNPKKCLKQCFAYKEGWVNIYGHPNSWKNDTSNRKGLNIPSSVLNILGTFMDSSSVLKLACCNRYLCNYIIDETFMNEYSKTIKNNYSIQKSQRDKNKKKLINFQKSDRWINDIYEVIRRMQGLVLTKDSGEEIGSTILQFINAAKILDKYRNKIINTVNVKDKAETEMKRLQLNMNELQPFLKK